ncbi:toll/interleukin-1 receptor-like protein isoform X3 [Solanum pennellii]|uniref:Toll/interleukin-1 receptor-like protein isoform X3 n=1 Tax=Solanum pennellii TaxID=28526 RepID=A0ABM1V877_SOLPN|nr:toll/interleukin-1 receptor-like protein isoform X3 [Solanum pennellii]
MHTLFVDGESSNSFQWRYNVFLSFSGEDTRKSFISHLKFRLCQVGISTFLDDEEVRKGEVISTKLEKAIELSRVSIVVFSKKYASSSWCLEELVKILECTEMLKKVVLPIFYGVDPSQVRKPVGYFDESLTRRFGVQRTQNWKTALTKAGHLSGWDFRNVVYRHESDLVESIIKRVLQEVSQTPLVVACYRLELILVSKI